LKSTGGAANVTAGAVSDLADALSLKTGIDDEAIQSGENLLLTFRDIRNEAGKGNDIFNQTTAIMEDMSVALGQDTKSSAIQLGKALNDPIRGMTALRRVGVTFNDAQTNLITKLQDSGDLLGAQKVILAELTKEFQGSAEAQKTASAQMSVQFENLAESVGRVLAPAVNFLLLGLTTFINFLEANVGPALKSLQAWFNNVMVKIQPLVNLLRGAAVDAVHKIWGSIQPLIPQLKKWWTEYQPLIKAIGLLAGSLLYLALKVLPPVVAFYLKFTELTLNAGGVVIGVVTTIIHAFEKVYDFFHHLPSRLAAAGAGMWDWLVQTLASAVNSVTGLINGMIDSINSFQIHVHQGLGPLPDVNVDWGGLGIPHIPSLAVGGQVMKTGLAMVHEGERFSGVGGNWGNVTVNVYGSVMTEHDLAESIQKALLKTKRRSGALGLA
jgi:hypothetical protein